MSIQIINPLEYPHWDDMLHTCGRATFFHTSAWARVLIESYRYEPLYFTIFENGKLGGLIPVMEIKSILTGKRGISLPFTDMCDPVAGTAETFNRLIKDLAAYGRQAGWRHFEIRGGNIFFPNDPFFAEHFVHSLELASDEAEVRKNFKSNTRRNIRKAVNEGVTVTLERSRGAVAEFYKLHCGTRRHHGLPPQPWSFFVKIHEHVISAGMGFVALARYRGRCIAGAVYMLYRDGAIYKYGASNRDSQRLRANNLVMWEAIRWLIGNGFRSLHFGRTELTSDGLLQFKRGWGVAEGRLNYYKYDFKRNRFAARKAGTKTSYDVFRILPMPILRLTGSLLYRHVA